VSYLTATSRPIKAYSIFVFQKLALTLSVFATFFLLALTAPPQFNDGKNEEQVGMRSFPGAGYPGFYPGMYPGGFPMTYPGNYLGGYPGAYPNIYGQPFGLGYPPIGYPFGGYPAGPFSFYNNKNGNTPTGSKAASNARN
jgi:hypothetical protein